MRFRGFNVQGFGIFEMRWHGTIPWGGDIRLTLRPLGNIRVDRQYRVAPARNAKGYY